MAISSKKNGLKASERAMIQEQGLPEDEVSPVIPPSINQTEALVDLTGTSMAAISNKQRLKAMGREKLQEQQLSADNDDGNFLCMLINTAAGKEALLVDQEAWLRPSSRLKRGRAEQGTLEEVEAELLRRKRQKREAWFDDEGNVVCVAITTPKGIQTYIPDAEGNLVPPSP